MVVSDRAIADIPLPHRSPSPHRITVVDSDGSGSDGNSGSDDDEPPPLEDMSDSIRYAPHYIALCRTVRMARVVRVGVVRRRDDV